MPPAIEASPEPPAGPPGPPTVPPRAAPAFDWESLIGVKLFAAIAGIALVLAAVFFLRYSVDQGWLQPPVRVAIGVIVVGRAARAVRAEGGAPVSGDRQRARRRGDRDPVRDVLRGARAVEPDPGARATFALLAVVTALAVLLSIRRESLFIAVLGLLGGFATPALLSTGENRPIPLFAYLLLLNIGLAWVAYRQVWPVLTWLTLVLTTLYQWGGSRGSWTPASCRWRWACSSCFPWPPSPGCCCPAGALTIASTPARQLLAHGDAVGGRAAALSSPTCRRSRSYGAHAPLLFGFLLIVDAGLLAIAIARRMPLTHALGAVGDDRRPGGLAHELVCDRRGLDSRR